MKESETNLNEELERYKERELEFQKEIEMMRQENEQYKQRIEELENQLKNSAVKYYIKQNFLSKKYLHNPNNHTKKSNSASKNFNN